jgi:hypothetical protein
MGAGETEGTLTCGISWTGPPDAPARPRILVGNHNRIHRGCPSWPGLLSRTPHETGGRLGYVFRSAPHALGTATSNVRRRLPNFSYVDELNTKEVVLCG